MRSLLAALFVVVIALGPSACGNPPPGAGPVGAKAEATGATGDRVELVKPPFAVQGDLEGLVLIWFDASGAHDARSRSEIPAEHRARVRVDSLKLSPAERLDPDQLYLADVRAPAADGSYPVQVVSREAFEASLEQAAAASAAARQQQAGDVIIYMASWCGACKATARFLHDKQVPFVEKDIEKDAAANAEMLQKAQAAGRQPSGVPVIDFKGTLLFGFDQAALTRLIEQS
jgi:glutaredoxin